MCCDVSLDTSGAAVPVSQAEESCGVRLSREKDQSLLFLSRYDSCYAHTEVQVTRLPPLTDITQGLYSSCSAQHFREVLVDRVAVK